MINIGIIGLGTIFNWQQKALNELSDNYKICAVYDIDFTKLKEMLGDGEIRIHQSIEAFLADDEIDTVAIMTPPHTHTALAAQCLRSHKHVLLEKPATLSMSELSELYRLASKNNVLFKVAYHASFAMDIEWYLHNQQKIREKYHLGTINKIECGFYDPYMENETIMPDKYALCGSFIDSAVNALSVCARLTCLDDFNLSNQNIKRGFPLVHYPDGIVYSADATYENNTCQIVIHTAWDIGLNQKTTTLSFEDSDAKLLLHHSEQSVFLIANETEKLLFSHTDKARLLNHYLGVYRSFAKDYSAFKANTELPGQNMTMNIHRLLLSNHSQAF